MLQKNPSLRREKALWEKGFFYVAGVDEVGVGALAGPVVAGAVVWPRRATLEGVRDSKLLSAKKRTELAERIQEECSSFCLGQASVEEITLLGIRGANLLAMRRAVEGLPRVEALLVDAWTIPDLSIPQQGIVRGDRFVFSIAAASILAKVFRDALMAQAAEVYPAYGFETHKGYATVAHREAIKRHGPCDIHRVSWGCFVDGGALV